MYSISHYMTSTADYNRCLLLNSPKGQNIPKGNCIFYHCSNGTPILITPLSVSPIST